MQSLSVRHIAPVRLAQRSRVPSVRSRLGLKIQSNTIWQLVPDKQWCNANPGKCDALRPVDLTDVVGRKAFATVGTIKDHSADSDEVITTNQEGVHVVFEARGEANPIDSPSQLFVMDIDSTASVLVDGSPVPKNTEGPVQVKPGARVQFGEDAVYQVHRNVRAHA